jgi:hypothetical protein
MHCSSEPLHQDELSLAFAVAYDDALFEISSVFSHFYFLPYNTSKGLDSAILDLQSWKAKNRQWKTELSALVFPHPLSCLLGSEFLRLQS